MKDNAAEHLTILVIDDKSEELSKIAAIVEEAGYRCHCAHDAPSAHEAVRHALPDMIIADMNLSGHSGLTLCDQLKQQTGMGEVPTLFLSTAQGPDIIRRAHATGGGGAYCLRKPFEAPILLQLIEKTRLTPHLAGV